MDRKKGDPKAAPWSSLDHQGHLLAGFHPMDETAQDAAFLGLRLVARQDDEVAGHEDGLLCQLVGIARPDLDLTTSSARPVML
jgi:hypothetical protein